jgi:hypothetical protein
VSPAKEGIVHPAMHMMDRAVTQVRRFVVEDSGSYPVSIEQQAGLESPTAT